MKKYRAISVVGVSASLLLVAVLVIYVVGYFALGQFFGAENNSTLGFRDFPNQFLADAYAPMAKVESTFQGGEITTACDSD